MYAFKDKLYYGDMLPPAGDFVAGDLFVLESGSVYVHDGSSWVPLGGGGPGTPEIQVFDTYADFHAASLDPADTRLVVVKGRSAPGDGGQGLFYHVPAGYNNDGTIIRDSSGTPWHRSFGAPVMAKWFFGSSVTLDLDAFILFLQNVATQHGAKAVDFAGVQVRIDSTPGLDTIDFDMLILNLGLVLDVDIDLNVASGKSLVLKGARINLQTHRITVNAVDDDTRFLVMRSNARDGTLVINGNTSGAVAGSFGNLRLELLGGFLQGNRFYGRNRLYVYRGRAFGNRLEGSNNRPFVEVREGAFVGNYVAGTMDGIVPILTTTGSKVFVADNYIYAEGKELVGVVDLRNGSDVHLRGNTIDVRTGGAGVAVRIDSVVRGFVQGNVISVTSGATPSDGGIQADNSDVILIEGNHIRGSGRGFAVSGDAERVLLVGNFMEEWECGERLGSSRAGGSTNRFRNLAVGFRCGGYANDPGDVDWS